MWKLFKKSNQNKVLIIVSYLMTAILVCGISFSEFIGLVPCVLCCVVSVLWYASLIYANFR